MEPITALPINPVLWTCDSRTTVNIPLILMPGGGIEFSFPVSPTCDPAAVDPWVTYFQAALDGKRPITGKSISYTFQLISDPSARFNYMSDANNQYPSNPARLHAYIKKSPLTVNGEGDRWWSKASWRLASNRKQVYTFSLNPELWINVDGTSETYPPMRQEFIKALANPTFIGMTFGGGYFFGHGVNVSFGQARFQLMSVTIQ